MKATVWANVPKHKGYWVSIDGKIVSFRTNGGSIAKTIQRHLKFDTVKGYHRVRLSNGDGTFKQLGVHRAVALAFLVVTASDVNHKDGNKINNVIENLEWATPSYNERHAWQTGLKKKKLCIEDARNIRASKASNDNLASAYNVSNRTIRDIRANRAWVEI
jgi:hypothetical protein